MLSDQQRLLLYAVSNRSGIGTPTPGFIASWLRNERNQPDANWQGVTRTIASLVLRDLVKRHRHPKMTWYEITPAGQQELDAESENGS